MTVERENLPHSAQRGVVGLGLQPWTIRARLCRPEDVSNPRLVRGYRRHSMTGLCTAAVCGRSAPHAWQQRHLLHDNTTSQKCVCIYTAVYSQTLTAISIFKYVNIVCIIQVYRALLEKVAWLGFYRPGPFSRTDGPLSLTSVWSCAARPGPASCGPTQLRHLAGRGRFSLY